MPLRRARHTWEDNIKPILKKVDARMWSVFTRMRMGRPMLDSYGQVNEISRFIKDEFVEYLSNKSASEEGLRSTKLVIQL